MSREILFLFRFTKPYLGLTILLLFCILFVTASNLATPYILKIILDELIPNKNFDSLVNVILLLFIIYVFRTIIGIVSELISHKIETGVITSIKSKLFYNLLKEPYSYFEVNNPGDIIQKVTLEADKVQRFISFGIIRLITNFFNVVSIIIALCYLSLNLFLITISVVPFSIYINRKLSKDLKKLVVKTSRVEGRIYNYYFDRIKNIKLVKVHNMFDNETTKLKEKLDHLFDLYGKSRIKSSIASNISSFSLSLGPLLVFLYGGNETIKGLMSIGTLVAFIQYMNRLYGPSNELTGLYVDYVKVKESAKIIYPVLSKSYPQDTDITSKKFDIQKLEIRGLSHLYGSNHRALNEFNYSFLKGKKYVITGSNGSGKSTLLKYLSRLYLDQNKNIYINDNIPIQSFSNQDWTSLLSYVSQETNLIYDTLLNNITYGLQNIETPELNAIIEDIGLDKFIEQLPLKLQTEIGQGDEGVVPSGGEAQLIALARVILNPKPLIIIDEGNSFIDIDKDYKVLEKLFKICRNSILIVVSHKLSNVQMFDEVIHLENGKIVEKGTPAYLIGNSGPFAKLFKKT